MPFLPHISPTTARSVTTTTRSDSTHRLSLRTYNILNKYLYNRTFIYTHIPTNGSTKAEQFFSRRGYIKTNWTTKRPALRNHISWNTIDNSSRRARTAEKDYSQITTQTSVNILARCKPEQRVNDKKKKPLAPCVFLWNARKIASTLATHTGEAGARTQAQPHKHHGSLVHIHFSKTFVNIHIYKSCLTRASQTHGPIQSHTENIFY